MDLCFRGDNYITKKVKYTKFRNGGLVGGSAISSDGYFYNLLSSTSQNWNAYEQFPPHSQSCALQGTFEAHLNHVQFLRQPILYLQYPSS